MIRKIFSALCALALLCSAALGQGVGQLGAGQVWGNPTAAQAIAQPSTPTSIIDRAICTTQGAILTRQAAGWLCLPPGTSGLALLSAGAGADVAYNILPLSAGGTNANLTASNGGIFYSTGTAGAILSGTAVAGQILRSGSSSAPSWSTATYPATTVAGSMLASLTASTITATRTPVLGVVGGTGTLGFSGATSGTATITPQAVAGTPTLTLPNTSGTFAVSATAPVAVSATTGNVTCTTCATTTNGGALSATAPVALSAGGAISITGAAGQVLAGATPAFTATPTLGVAGSTVGTVGFQNATSGTITLSPPTGALGTQTLTLPAATDTLIGKATTDTLTNKTFDTAGAGNSLLINGLAATANTGTGSVVRATSPSLTTPNIGVATATSINGFVPASAMATTYAEGTWTPGYAGDSTAGTPTYSIQVGNYEKIGRLVVVRFFLKITATGGAAGNILVTGLPFTAGATSNDLGYCTVPAYITASMPANNFSLSAYVLNNTTNIVMNSLGATGQTQLSVTNGGAGFTIAGSCVYHT